MSTAAPIACRICRRPIDVALEPQALNRPDVHVVCLPPPDEDADLWAAEDRKERQAATDWAFELERAGDPHAAQLWALIRRAFPDA